MNKNHNLDDLFQRALRRIRSGTVSALQGTALASALIATAPATITGCTDEQPEAVDDGSMSPGGKSDWAQDEGERRPDMVSYTGDAWSECKESSSRTGCYGYELILKIMVTPVANVEPTAKKVGVVYRSVDNPYTGERTATGQYFTTAADGREEWHVPVHVYTNEDLIKFNAWYQPGNDKTYYDDNNGEHHVYSNNNNAMQVVQVSTWESTVSVAAGKVKGTIKVRVADIDFDKVIGMHATIDGWQTTLQFGVGSPGQKNKFYWVADTWGNMEYWQIDLDIDGADIQELRYAVFYDHGVVNNAHRYTFWDNNFGSDYRVTRNSGGSSGGNTRG